MVPQAIALEAIEIIWDQEMKLQQLITMNRNPKSQLFSIQTVVTYLWHMVRS